MPATPWTTINSPQPGNRYLGLLSFLPLKHYRGLPSFFRFAFAIQKQLKSSPGLIGYALDAHLFRLRFWTLSVWLNQESLNAFVGRLPHSAAMQALAPHMGKTQFAQWSVGSAEIPLDWPAAKARITKT